MLKSIWEWVLRLFGIDKTPTTTEQQESNSKYTDEYTDIKNTNFTAIFANKLATLAVSESEFLISDDNRRAKLLSDICAEVWKRIKKITAMALGCGGAIIVPYVQNGGIFFDIATQDRLCINKKSGGKIVSATVLADTVVINSVRYFRFVNYSIENGNLYITNKTTTQYGRPATVEQWENIQDIAIANVDRVPFGYIKSPVDNRISNDDYGVPVTYGCKKIIDEIKTCLTQIVDEFELKQVRLRIDERDLDKDEKGKPILKGKLFMVSKNYDNNNVFDIFDPAIRESSYYTRLTNLFELLEKSVGTSKGILTVPESRGATATEIKASLYDTYAMICDIRAAIESGITDFLYACDVLANYFSLSPAAEYTPVFDWSYSLIESSTETWQQLKDAQAIGVRSKAEIRAWQTGETIEEAQKAVDEITAKEPGLNTLLGMDEGGSTPPENEIAQDIDDTVTKQLNGAQTQSLINIVMQFQQGVLTEGQAISIISTSIGVSKQQAEDLLKA